MSAVMGQDVLLVDARVKADSFDASATGRSELSQAVWCFSVSLD
jgi:hypothetical protein